MEVVGIRGGMGAVGIKDQGRNGGGGFYGPRGECVGGGCWGRLGPGVVGCGGSVGWL